MRRFFVSAICSIAILFSSAAYAETPKSLVKVKKLTNAQIVNLASQGYDIARRGVDFAEMVLDQSEIQEFVKNGHPVNFVIEDLDAYIKNIKAKQTKNTAYFTYSTMETTMKGWAEKYSNICRLESIGKSCEGRDIWALKISDNPEVNEPEPAALLMGAHHAREWPSVEVPMATARKMLEEYESNEEVKQLVDNRETWFVPMVNPDGMTYSMEKSRMWRKNRFPNANGTFGVDLNRNYGYQWGNVGASSSGSSDTYHGTGPFSELESVAMRDFAIREKFQASISFHTYSELVLYPFGYGYNIPNPDRKVFVKMAGDMARFNGYTPKNSAELYPAMGDSDDYFYGELKMLAFTFELCSTFIPPATQIKTFNEQNVPAALYLIDKCGTYGLVTPAANDEIINALSLDASLRAIVDNVDLFGTEGNIAMRNEALKQLEKICQRASSLVCEDLKTGSSEGWQKIRAIPQARLAISFIRNRVLFDSAHGSSLIRPELVEEIKNS